MAKRVGEAGSSSRNKEMHEREKISKEGAEYTRKEEQCMAKKKEKGSCGADDTRKNDRGSRKA